VDTAAGDYDAGLVDVGGAAALARGCRVVEQALQLAGWVAAVPRPVTAGKVLRRPDVGAAGAVLDVAVPSKVRTAADLPQLHRPWCVAVGLGLISVDANKAGAGPGLDRWPALDETVLEGWLAGLRAACAAESDRRFPDSVSILVWAALRVLAVESVSAGDSLERLVHTTLHGNAELYNRYDSLPPTGTSTSIPAG
jgi:hypothetical protein